MLIIGLP